MAEGQLNLTVVDVYDQAAIIGKEFECIIDNFGADAVTSLMPKVIRILEQLEILASRNEKENQELNDLRFAVERLQHDKLEKAEERMKYEKELEQIEETWRAEAKELLDMVGKLQDENRKLSCALQNQDDEPSRPSEEDLRVMTKLKETVDKQRDQVRAIKRELGQKNVDLEAMAYQLERVSKCNKQLELRLLESDTSKQAIVYHNDDSMQAQLKQLAKLNADLRRKNNNTQRQARNLIEERTDLETQLQEKEQQISQIKEKLMNQDSLESPESPSGYFPGNPLMVKSTDSSADAECLDKINDIAETLSPDGGIIINMKDPDRPRFTLNELREVLLERNELKSKLYEVEEELAYYKPKSEEDDPPVQGPINREPEEKLYPEKMKNSGIRKFFRFFFGDSAGSTKRGKQGNAYALNALQKRSMSFDSNLSK